MLKDIPFLVETWRQVGRAAWIQAFNHTTNGLTLDDGSATFFEISKYGREEMSLSRRGFVQSGVVAGLLADPVAGRAAQAIVAPVGGWPRTKVGNLHALKPNEPVSISYPDAGSPALLVKLGQAAYQGVGPDRDVVAFSAICTHMGCPVSFEGDRFVCPCHYSMYDPAKNGQVYQGLAADYLPQISLAIESATGDIYAERMSGLIWGRSRDLMEQG